jgi:transcriptional regulator with XRE-family HTH domain
MRNRIQLFMRARNLNAAQLAEEINVQKSGISHILSGRNNPSLDFMQKILTRYPEINSEWLIMGNGAMFKEMTGFESMVQNPSQHTDKESVNDLFSSIEPPENSKIDNSNDNNQKEIPYLKSREPDRELKDVKLNVISERLSKSNTIQASNSELKQIIMIYSDNSFTVIQSRD